MMRRRIVLAFALVALASTASAAGPSSEAAQPSVGASTEEHRALMISAQVMRKESKLLRSRDLLSACSSKDCDVNQSAECGEIRGFCTKLLADVANEIPTVSITVRDDRGRPVRAERLEVDSLAIDPSVPVLTDPGAHIAKALFGGRSGEAAFVVTTGQKNIAIVVSINLKEKVQRRPVPLPVYVLGGTGLVGGILAITTGVYTAHSYSNLDGCQPFCDSSQESRLRTTGYIADVSTIVALASAIAGTIWFVARPTITETRWVGDENAERTR
jgi:hypothetical protein